MASFAFALTNQTVLTSLRRSVHGPTPTMLVLVKAFLKTVIPRRKLGHCHHLRWRQSLSWPHQWTIRYWHPPSTQHDSYWLVFQVADYPWNCFFWVWYVAARTAMEQIIDLRLTPRYLGVPIDGPSFVFGDNKSVVNTASVLHSKLQKRHNALSHHCTRKAVATGITRFHHIVGTSKPAGILSKHWGHLSVWDMLRPLMFWQGDSKATPTPWLSCLPTSSWREVKAGQFYSCSTMSHRQQPTPTTTIVGILVMLGLRSGSVAFGVGLYNLWCWSYFGSFSPLRRLVDLGFPFCLTPMSFALRVTNSP